MVLKIRKSIKLKRRYLLIDSGDKECIEKVLLDYLGIIGYSRADIFWMSPKKDKLVFSVNSRMLDDIRAAFEISKCHVKIIRISSSIRGVSK